MYHKRDLGTNSTQCFDYSLLQKTPTCQPKIPKPLVPRLRMRTVIPPVKMQNYLSRSACACLQAPSPLNADRLNEAANPLQPFLGVDPSGWSLTRVAAISSPRSRSLSRGIGIAAEGESLAVSAAWVWMSLSSGSSWYGRWTEETAVAEEACAIERTTSPLQIGHVRRRVVSQGVLDID